MYASMMKTCATCHKFLVVIVRTAILLFASAHLRRTWPYIGKLFVLLVLMYLLLLYFGLQFVLLGVEEFCYDEKNDQRLDLAFVKANAQASTCSLLASYGPGVRIVRLH